MGLCREPIHSILNGERALSGVCTGTHRARRARRTFRDGARAKGASGSAAQRREQGLETGLKVSSDDCPLTGSR